MFAATASIACAAPLTSPDGLVAVTVGVDAGQAFYRVELAGRRLLDDSPLGLVTSQADLSQELSLTSASAVATVRHAYELQNGKTRQVDSSARRQSYTFTNSSGVQFSVVLEVSNDGVAFAYQLHGDQDEQVVVEQELTGFALPQKSRSFLHPMHQARSGWEETNPSYEAHYVLDRPVGEPSPDGQGWCFPALFHVPESGWLLVSETGVDGRYCGMHLAHKSTDGLYRVAFPQSAASLPIHPVHPTVAGHAQLPWRTIAVGRTLAPIVASTLATDLVEPLYELDSPPTLGIAAWSWVFLKDSQTVEPIQRQFIDMAADMGWKHVLIDSMWDQQIGRERITELVEYARAKHVGILLWYNSNPAGADRWNNAPMTPKSRMHTPEVREQEMAWLEEIGVAGLKVDFFGGDKQAVMQLYDGLLRDGARHGLSINFHGTTLPRGWERMYPNFVTNEAVKGMEFITFEQGNADLQPEHCCVLPFTRNVVGPMDFTPVILSRRLQTDGKGPHRRTSDGFELALPVLFQSGVQHLGVTPDQLADQPAFVREYLSRVPTTWDETRLLDGYPGRYVALARRAGDTWFVAAINGTSAPLALALDLSFADANGWQQLTDGDHSVEENATAAASDGIVSLHLQAAGGAVLIQLPKRRD